MYEELVKRLRGESEYADLVAYIHGIHHTRQEDMTAKIAKSWKELFAKAADTIEELSREIDTDNAAMTAMDAAMPRWIPVTEKLPDEDGKYLCTVRSFSQYNNKQYRFVDILVFQDGCFFECGIGTDRVTHWMPLPHPPEANT